MANRTPPMNAPAISASTSQNDRGKPSAQWKGTTIACCGDDQERADGSDQHCGHDPLEIGNTCELPVSVVEPESYVRDDPDGYKDEHDGKER